MHGDIIVYGAEDREGRAFLAVSALHHCGRWLVDRRINVRFVATSRPVTAALELLRFHTGLEAAFDDSRPREQPDRVFANAGLYVGVVFSRPGVLALGEARKRGVPCLAAVQFPNEKNLSISVIENMRCAFDPRELSRRLCSEVSRLETPGAVS